MANWIIEPQILNQRGCEIEVPIKNVRFYPMQDEHGDLKGFGRLKNPILQIKLNQQGSTSPALRLQWIHSEGTEGKFVIKWPDKEEHPKFKTGSGKTKAKPWDSRQQWEDTSKPTKKVAGPKEEFNDGKAFVEFLATKFKLSDSLLSEIVGLFLQAINEMLTAREEAA